MPQADVTRFFQMVYDDRELQGALNSALCEAAPAIVVAIAKAKGCDFSADELKKLIGDDDKEPSSDASGSRELSKAEVEQVAGGIGLGSLGSLNLNFGGRNLLGSNLFNFWGRMFRPHFGGKDFDMVIKGPLWNKLMVYRKAGWEAAPAEKRSVVALHQELEAETADKA